MLPDIRIKIRPQQIRNTYHIIFIHVERIKTKMIRIYNKNRRLFFTNLFQ